jgi:hypothetical protein
MKKSKLFLLGILITGLAFGLVLAGCVSTEGTEDPTAAELAAQLAADINAIKPGSAEVDGATVTLSGGLSLESQFTVPAGVTLDLTGDGELGLLDATLTVNGTVKAGSNKVRMRSAASWGTINGSGTIQLKGKGTLFNFGDNKKLTLDGVTLVGVADNSDPLVRGSEGGEFVMKSGKITGNTRINDGSFSGGGVEVYRGGTFTLEGGVISGNTVKAGEHASGGGVWIGGGAVFIMSGGAITGNTAAGTNTNRSGQGGGVDVRGTFTMSGGKISGNTAEGDEHGGGGGVRIIGDGASFTMTGGEISGNSATAVNGSSTGGGVKLETGTTFIMEGGTISGNTVVDGSGGGVNVQEGAVFTLKGGTIYGKVGSLPAGSDANLANIAQSDDGDAALNVSNGTAKWGTGGTYTKGGVSQTGGTDIGSTDDTLIAIPAQ